MPGEKRSHSFFSSESDLFAFDKSSLAGEILLSRGDSAFEYHEFATYSVPRDASKALKSKIRSEDPHHITHKRSIEEPELAHDAFQSVYREGYGLDINGEFTSVPSNDPVLEGRVREIVCFRRNNIKREDGSMDGLAINQADLNVLKLHPASLQYTRRTTTESRFWDRHHEKLSLILSFSAHPTTPFDFLSMTYSLPTRTADVLIRQSYNPRQHGLSDLDEYDQRLEAARTHWSHPFILPVVCLQVQFTRTEEAVAENNAEVLGLERDVAGMAGFDPSDSRVKLPRRTSNSPRGNNANANEKDSKSGNGGTQVYQNTTTLMRTAHDTLKRSIKLLDTMRWMERAFQLLLDAGEELQEKMNEQGMVPDGGKDPLVDHWHEIRQYLDGLLRLCMSLETDRRMSEQRCRAQIDIIYAKMAQEDNNLNARMAVATTRDSSSMKALAVITAIFLPAEFLGTMFGMSFFEFLPEDNNNGRNTTAADATSTSASASSALANKDAGDHVLSPLFWVYWAAAIPLTVVILVAWRAWWVAQDRYFRKHLSPELSQERYWTADGQPRPLGTSFVHDFFFTSSHKDEAVPTQSAGGGNGNGGGKNGSSGSNGKGRGFPAGATFSRSTSVQKSSDTDDYTLGPAQSSTPPIRLRDIAGARKRGSSLLP